MTNEKLYLKTLFDGKSRLYGVTLKLTADYYDYFNNYLSYAKYAEHNGMTEEQAAKYVTLAREVYHSTNIDY